MRTAAALLAAACLLAPAAQAAVYSYAFDSGPLTVPPAPGTFVGADPGRAEPILTPEVERMLLEGLLLRVSIDESRVPGGTLSGAVVDPSDEIRYDPGAGEATLPDWFRIDSANFRVPGRLANDFSIAFDASKRVTSFFFGTLSDPDDYVSSSSGSYAPVFVGSRDRETGEILPIVEPFFFASDRPGTAVLTGARPSPAAPEAPAPIPLPASAWLLGAALAGLTAWGRRGRA